MIPYLIPLLLCIIGIMLYDSGRIVRYKEVLFWTICTYCIFLFGLRDGIGYDTVWRYQRGYELSTYLWLGGNSAGQPIYISDYAPAVKVLFYLFRMADLPWWSLQLLISFAINAIFFYFIRNNVKNVFVAVLLYLTCDGITYNTEVLRQALAVCVFLLAWPSLRDRKWWLYTLWVIIAFQFHYTAVILAFVPLAYIFSLQLNRRFILVIVLFTLIVGALYLFSENLAWIFGETYGKKMFVYLNLVNPNFNCYYYIYHIGLITLLPLAIVIYYKYWCRRTIEFEPMICCLIMIGVVALFFGEAGLRLRMFFLPFFLFSTANCIGSGLAQAKEKTKYINAVILAAIILIFSYQTYKSAMISDEYIPYRSIMSSNHEPK